MESDSQVSVKQIEDRNEENKDWGSEISLQGLCVFTRHTMTLKGSRHRVKDKVLMGLCLGDLERHT